ncbi:membrane protein [Luteipulveratus halotolerans]|uniref:Membrane protein n=2 Tax=Luteipulveratus halotolerans TaxID=1631356 RepID=A0A0L6CNC3_9MICO|nr:DUF445 domain-containing protein [Luteipulveratus halotolerans]KNX39249.1 membrane protein [Luteipulveratus halotolerans]
MRLVATSLLVIAAVVFIATHGRDGGWGYVNAAAEAAMVGAVADWFAVTALFRHPLGLPVPHTALIPKKKDALGESLEDFVTENFLTADIVQERLAQAQIPLRLGRWVSDPEHAATVVREAAPALSRAVSSVQDAEVRTLLEGFFLPRLAQEPISEIAGHLLDGVLQDRSHQGLVDLGIGQVHDWARDNKATIASIIGARAPWWSPRWLDETVTDRLYAEIMSWLGDVRDNAEHPARHALDDLLAGLARDLQHDPQTQARAEALKERFLTHPGVADGMVSVWGSVQHTLVEALADEDGPLRARMSALLADAGRRLVADDQLRGAVDRRLHDVAGYVVTTYGREISTLISQTVARWDGDEAARRIELQVGRDLQFIRINGTVVGGLVGLLIHALSQLP